MNLHPGTNNVMELSKQLVGLCCDFCEERKVSKINETAIPVSALTTALFSLIMIQPDEIRSKLFSGLIAELERAELTVLGQNLRTQVSKFTTNH